MKFNIVDFFLSWIIVLTPCLEKLSPQHHNHDTKMYFLCNILKLVEFYNVKLNLS